MDNNGAVRALRDCTAECLLWMHQRGSQRPNRGHFNHRDLASSIQMKHVKMLFVSVNCILCLKHLPTQLDSIGRHGYPDTFIDEAFPVRITLQRRVGWVRWIYHTRWLAGACGICSGNLSLDMPVGW